MFFMERAPITERDIPEFKPENYIGVKPKDVNNFRMQAALILIDRHFTEEELQKINAENLSSKVEFKFTDDLYMIRFTFPTKTMMEVYCREDSIFRIIYNHTEETLKTTREPKLYKFAQSA